MALGPSLLTWFLTQPAGHPFRPGGSAAALAVMAGAREMKMNFTVLSMRFSDKKICICVVYVPTKKLVLLSKLLAKNASRRQPFIRKLSSRVQTFFKRARAVKNKSYPRKHERGRLLTESSCLPFIDFD